MTKPMPVVEVHDLVKVEVRKKGEPPEPKTYLIVNDETKIHRAAVDGMAISKCGPLAKAILGKRAGLLVTVQAPRSSYQVKILEILPRGT